MLRIAHVINPVKVEQDSLFFKIQQKTIESIEFAKKSAVSNTLVDLFYVQGENESFELREWKLLGTLKQSISDLHPKFHSRKLPLFQDIVELIAEKLEKYDLVIYSNMDIGLMPFFYDFIHNQFLAGFDAITINRRRISPNLLKDKNLSSAYSSIGKSHPGFDCFALRPNIIKQLNFETICLGVPFFEVAMIHQIVAFAENPCWIMDKHLTFHFGYDVLNSRKNVFYVHNRNEFEKKILPKIKSQLKLSHFPYAKSSVFKQIIQWGLNPSIFIKEYPELKSKSLTYKIRFLLNEIRWRIIQK